MKKNTLLIFSILTSSLLIAQVPKGTLSLEDTDFNRYFFNTAKIPIVKGKILNLSTDDLRKINISYSIVTPFSELQNKKVTTVNSDGSFNLQLDYPFPYQQIWMRIGDTLYTCLYANSDLFIEIDAAKLNKKNGIMFNGEGIKFLGCDGELTAIMNNHILFKRDQQLKLNEEISTLNDNKQLTDKEFIQKYDELYSKIQLIDNDFIKENPSKYAWIIDNERMSNYYADLCVWYWGKTMSNELWGKVKNHKSYIVSNSGMCFYNYLYSYISIPEAKTRIMDWNEIRKYSAIDSMGKNLIDSMIYFQQLKNNHEPFNAKSYYNLVKQANLIFSDTITAINTFKTIKSLDSIFEPAKADFLKIKMGSQELDKQKIISGLILTHMITDWCKNVVNSEYQKTLGKINSVSSILNQSKPIISVSIIGQPIAELPFGAKLYKVNNIKAQELLSNLKNSFKDKAILIDFWATWCAPCLSEMPYSKKLHEDTKDLPIEFVYLCTSSNSSIEKWKSKIAELEIPGIHIFVEETIETELMNLFSLSGYPSYILINTKGVYKPGFIRPSAFDKNKLTELINR